MIFLFVLRAVMMLRSFPDASDLLKAKKTTNDCSLYVMHQQMNMSPYIPVLAHHRYPIRQRFLSS